MGRPSFKHLQGIISLNLAYAVGTINIFSIFKESKEPKKHITVK